jgi:hypothetical protein
LAEIRKMSDVGLMSLSNEILLKIFLHMRYASDILLLGATCTRLAAISKDEVIWQHLVKRDFPEVVQYIVCSSVEGRKDGGTICSREPSVRTSSSTGSVNRGSNSEGPPGGHSAGGSGSGGASAGGPSSGEPRIGEDEYAVLFATWRSAYRYGCGSIWITGLQGEMKRIQILHLRWIRSHRNIKFSISGYLA